MKATAHGTVDGKEVANVSPQAHRFVTTQSFFKQKKERTR